MDLDQQPSSLVHLSACELFPKKALHRDDKSLQVNFPELNGECVEFLTATADATLALSNFRLFITFKCSFLNIPLMLIESVELRDLFILQVNCKDARSFRIVFDSNDQSVDWLHKVSAKILPYSRIEDLFAFAHYAWSMASPNSFTSQDASATPYSFLEEVHRMGFETGVDSPWRISDANSSFEVCRTYPRLHVIPSSISDSDLAKVASFRCSGRFPSIVWRHMTNGAVIARCSQPQVGWLGWRSAEDELLLQAIGQACTSDRYPSVAKLLNGITVNGINKKHDMGDVLNGPADMSEDGPIARNPKQVLIVDARSYTAAYANRGKGGGFEYTEYYPNCEVMFMNLANIHGIRRSFHSLRALCSGSYDVPNWWSLIEKTNWLHHISMLIKSAVTIVHAVHTDGRPVVVHCSDGWDRTTQIVALAELLLDPFYRTIEGFKILIDREWLQFGHRFADRCGHGSDIDENERCPVFLQWLDCVHQLQKQFPSSFEFSETYLIKLLHHTYSCLFGTFLGNNEHGRHTDAIKARTLSVWSYILPRKKDFRNLLYAGGGDQVLQPSYHLRSLQLWSAVYLAYPTDFAGHVSSDHSEPANKNPSSPTPPRFPFNHSDTNLEMKAGVSDELPASKSDGDLAACLRNDPCKNSLDDNEDNLTKSTGNGVSVGSKNGVCCRCRSVDGMNCVHSGLVNGHVTDSQSDQSMYYSMAGSCTPEEGGDGQFSDSMSSSTATVVLERSQTGSELESRECDSAPENNVTDNVNVDENSKNLLKKSDSSYSCETSKAECKRLEASSYEDLSPHSGEESETQTTDHKENDKDIESDEGPSATLPGLPENSQPLVAEDDSSKEVSSRAETSTQTLGSASSTTAATQTCETTTTLARSHPVYARFLDSDGLTAVPDPIQDRLRQIEMMYQAQIEALHCQVVEERRRRVQGCGDAGSQGRHGDLADEVCSLPDSTQSGDQPPPSCGSSADETSWIQIDEGDAEPTRWVPDHAATNCANCHTGFWIANRKHHCRNCGQVFCSTCSDHKLPVPEEQLYDPVRVCIHCFGKLVSMETRENGGRRRGHEVNSVPG